MLEPLRRKLRVFLELTEEEEAFLTALRPDPVHYSRGSLVISEGDPFSEIYVVRQGWCINTRTLPDGRRQIINFVLPGDFMCFNAALLKVSTTSFFAVTETEASRLSVEDIAAVYRGQPRLAAALTWCNAQDESILAERLTSLGRRSAYERVAHLFVELWRRLELLGHIDTNELILPVTREQLADATGLTTTHIYRTLRRLEGDQLVGVRPRSIAIHDFDGLHRAAKFEEDFLHYTQIPARTERILSRVKSRDPWAHMPRPL